ncbi:MAG: hypothetical protein ACI4LB_08095 [Candidatus Fimenecus sp.]
MFKRIFSLVLLFAVLLSGCGAKPNAQETTTIAPQTTVQSDVTSTPDITAGQTETTTTAPTSTALETSVPFSMPEKKGEMAFTDDPNDKFIQAIVQKYGSDPARLACIYAVPEADNNHVFEFNGKTDANGKLIRNEDTLKYVYTLNADCSTITRAAGFTGNDGLSAAQGYAIFEVTKKLVLPEFEEELNG